MKRRAFLTALSLSPLMPLAAKAGVDIGAIEPDDGAHWVLDGTEWTCWYGGKPVLIEWTDLQDPTSWDMVDPFQHQLS
jgi:hypothetical protein